MKKKTLFVSVLAAIILILVSIAPSINADVSKPDIDVVEENVTPTPIALVLQLITKLRNHKDIQQLEENIDSVENVEDEILRIIESNEELNIIFEQLSGNDEDCGCEDETTDLDFPFFICLLLFPLMVLGWAAWFMGGVTWIGELFFGLNSILNCPFHF